MCRGGPGAAGTCATSKCGHPRNPGPVLGWAVAAVTPAGGEPWFLSLVPAARTGGPGVQPAASQGEPKANGFMQ